MTEKALGLVTEALEDLRKSGRMRVLRAVAAYRRAHLVYRLTGAGDEDRLREIDALLREASEHDVDGVLGPWPQLYRIPALHRLGRQEEARQVWMEAVRTLDGWRHRRTEFVGGPEELRKLMFVPRIQSEGFSLLELVSYMVGYDYDDLFRPEGRQSWRLPEPSTLRGPKTWAVLDSTGESVTELPLYVALSLFRERQRTLLEEGRDVLVYGYRGGRGLNWVAPLRGERSTVQPALVRLLAVIQLGAEENLADQRRRFMGRRSGNPDNAFNVAKSKLLGLQPEVIGEEGWAPFADRRRGEVLRLSADARILGLVDVGRLRRGHRESDVPVRPGRDSVALGWIGSGDRISQAAPRGQATSR